MFYADSVGVFPYPYDPVASPGGGITECAVINEPFEFVFTIAVGDSITAEVFGAVLTLPLSKVVVNSIDGLPEGISLLCEPANCEYLSGTLGCAVLTGIPTDVNTPGAYPLTINGTAFFPVFPFQYNLTFPGVLASGEYTLQLLSDASEPCNVVGTRESLRDKIDILASPNPASDRIQVEINARISGEFNLQVVDLLGREVYTNSLKIQEGINRTTLDAGNFPSGLYMMVLENERGRVAGKITIQH